MSKINIPNIREGFNLTKINDAFATIVDHLNNKVLYRNVPLGEPNQLGNDIDTNGKRIYNLPQPVEDHEPMRKIDVANSQNILKTLRVDDVVLPPFVDANARRNKVVMFDNNGNPVVISIADLKVLLT